MAAPTATGAPGNPWQPGEECPHGQTSSSHLLGAQPVSAGRRQRSSPTPTSPCFQLPSCWCSHSLSPQGFSQCLGFPCAVCLCADPTLLPTPLAEAWARAWCHPLAEQRCCQGPTTVGLWSCSDPGRAGWQQAEGGQDLHSFASTSNRDVETTTSDAWQEKKRELNAEFHPPLILFSKFMEKSCSFSQGNSASLTDWHCLCCNWVLKKQSSLQKNVSASTRNNRKSKWA